MKLELGKLERGIAQKIREKQEQQKQQESLGANLPVSAGEDINMTSRVEAKVIAQPVPEEKTALEKWVSETAVKASALSEEVSLDLKRAKGMKIWSR
ncbi:MAG: hypothetical protein JWQ66_2396 [Mucilaginibacter sp.]|nr:hypothetical protein [Mucilaginibacter sp.]